MKKLISIVIFTIIFATFIFSQNKSYTFGVAFII